MTTVIGQQIPELNYEKLIAAGRAALVTAFSAGPTVPDLVALHAVSNGALTSAELPKRLKILNWGRNESTKGVVVLDDLSIQSLATNQRAMGFETIALDFEHNTVPGTEEFKRSQEPRAVAAYGTPEIVKGDGLYLVNLEWTPQGKASAKNYKDLSPAASLDVDGRVTFLHSTALTRNGAVHDLTFFSATQNNKKTMADNALTITDLATALGFETTADKATVLKKLGALVSLSAALEMKEGKVVVLSAFDTRLKGVEDLVKKLEPGDKVVVFSATVDGKEVKFKPEDLVSKVVHMENLFTASADAAVKAERETLIARFSAEGKVPLGADNQPLSAEKLTTMNVGELKLLINNTPVTVPMNARGTKAKEGGGKPMTAAEVWSKK